MACAPMLCLDVTRMWRGERVEMRMMHPFDLCVSSYGGAECFGIASHCEHASQRPLPRTNKADRPASTRLRSR